ncbi:MAG: SH3 domain-containing protein [Chloroflexi bacterium]|nr:SH3 domain-containing protein [Chloroflexota bacterium]
MHSEGASRWSKVCWLALIWVALVSAGCNLGISGEGAPEAFEGPPAVHIAAPWPGQSFEAGATVIVQARVEKAGPDLARISVLLNDALLGERLNPNETGAAVLPLTIDWPTSKAGDFTISVLAERGDGSFAREDVNIIVMPKAEPASAPSTESTRSDAAGANVLAAPALADKKRVGGTMTQPARIRAGPGAAYDLLGNLDENHEVMIVAVNPTRDWYRIEYDGSIEAWVYAQSVRLAGDIAGLPVESGPPLPAEQGVNLLVLDVMIEPPVVCNQESIVKARVRNDGTDEAQSVAWVIAEPVLVDSGASLSDNPPLAYLKTLDAAEEDTIEFPITLTTHVSEEQFIRVVVDSGNHLPEMDETDNARDSAAFILEPGSCV